MGELIQTRTDQSTKLLDIHSKSELIFLLVYDDNNKTCEVLAHRLSGVSYLLNLTLDLDIWHGFFGELRVDTTELSVWMKAELKCLQAAKN